MTQRHEMPKDATRKDEPSQTTPRTCEQWRARHFIPASVIARAIVLHRLDEFRLGVHHERAVLEHRLADRPAAQDQDLERGPVRILQRLGGHADPIAGAEHRQLSLVDRMADRSDRTPAGQHIDKRVESRFHGRFSRAPGSIVACANVIGVCVAPGPGWPSMSPAMMRTNAPPSSEDSSFTWLPSMA
jgi:hypothetical protein